jgi:hypothetical protein
MKSLVLFFSLIASVAFAQVTADKVEMERVKCELIKCDDLVAQNYYRCRVQEKNCYKRVFEMNMHLWREDGVNQAKRSEVLRTLEQSKRSHRQLIDRLNEEVSVAQKEILEIDLQIEAVKKLPGRR